MSIAKELDAKGYSCFLDQLDTQPGKELPPSLLRRIRYASIFLVVGSPGAMESAAIRKELETFKTTGRPILPVDFGCIREASWYSKIEGIPEASDSLTNLKSGTPSMRMLLRAEKSLGYMRQKKRLSIIVSGALLLTITLLGSSLFLGNRIRAANRDINQLKSEAQMLQENIAALREKEHLMKTTISNWREKVPEIMAYFQDGLSSVYKQPSLDDLEWPTKKKPFRIYIYTDQHIVSDDAEKLLEEFVGFCKKVSYFRIKVAAHVARKRIIDEPPQENQEELHSVNFLASISDEFALALGEKMAQGVSNFLVDQGIPSDKISTVSYGKGSDDRFLFEPMNNRVDLWFE